MLEEAYSGSSFLAQRVPKTLKSWHPLESTILPLGIYPKETSDPCVKMNDQGCLSQSIYNID